MLKKFLLFIALISIITTVGCTRNVEEKEITINIGDESRTGKYTGMLVDGIPNGEGEFKSVNVENVSYTYKGNFSSGTFNGQGRIDFDSEHKSHVGLFTNGEYTPDLLESVIYLGSDNTHKDDKEETLFEPTNKAEEFIKANYNIFPASNIEDINSFIDTEVVFKKIFKSPNSFGDKLIKYDGTVARINEFDLFGKTWSLVQINTGRTIYYGDEEIDYSFYYTYYPGQLADILDGDKITVYGLPINTTSFTNVSNTTTSAVVLLGSIIVKR